MRIRVRVCARAHARTLDGTVFVCGGCFVFQTFIYLTLIFHVCIYLKNPSHTSQYRQ